MDGQLKIFCHRVYAGHDKETNKEVVISTWQSIYGENKNISVSFDVVFVDEAHLAKAKSFGWYYD